ncbi:hypothetical protein HON71_01685 [Candidatus Woesearchaeota archaeon]|jgi:hypothetical protein|nr:hypothetical protein [Candidatus Woesearchaeota archaeon]MBT5342511.1 hypothetical protein [Candidatus Woesearchaeota archaeon]
MKLIKFLVIIVLFMFLLGCGSSSGPKQGIQNFKQGYGSLDVRFLDNSPPEKIYQGSKFKMIVELDNQAAYDLEGGQIKIMGVDEKFFLMSSPLTNDFSVLMGKSLVSPSGEKIFVEFDATALNELFENAERFQNPFFVKVSFDSVFEFTDTVCINPNLYEVYDSGCKVQPKKSYSGQGAPVAVTELESVIYPSSAGTETEFRILVKNRGSGKANLVVLEGGKLGNQELKDCHFQNSVKDSQGKKVLFYKKKQEDLLICKLFLRDQVSYETTLSLDFSYNYEISKKHQLNMYK